MYILIFPCERSEFMDAHPGRSTTENAEGGHKLY